MPANVRTMAFRGETPWHGLGNTITSGMTLDEILEIAGMDYTIECLDLGARIGDLKEVNDVAKRQFMKVDGYKLVWSPQLKTVFQVATDRYQPVQPASVVEFFREFCDKGDLEIETAGVLKDGAINWCLAKTAHSFELAGQDKSNTYVMLATSHDGSMRTVVLPTSIRVVCQNTLQLAFSSRTETDKMFSLKHSAKFTEVKMNEAKKQVGLIVERAEKFALVSEKLSEVKVTRFMTDSLIYKLTQPKLWDEIVDATEARSNQQRQNASVLLDILDNDEVERKLADMEHNRVGKAILDSIVNSPGSNLPSSEDTLWGVVNGVSYYVDHVAGTEDRDKALTSAWFGSRSNLKDSVLELCLEMASK